MSKKETSVKSELKMDEGQWEQYCKTVRRQAALSWVAIILSTIAATISTMKQFLL